MYILYYYLFRLVVYIATCTLHKITNMKPYKSNFWAPQKLCVPFRSDEAMKMILDAILLSYFAALVWLAESFPTGKRVAISTQLQASCNLAKPMGIATYVSVRF